MLQKITEFNSRRAEWFQPRTHKNNCPLWAEVWTNERNWIKPNISTNDSLYTKCLAIKNERLNYDIIFKDKTKLRQKKAKTNLIFKKIVHFEEIIVESVIKPIILTNEPVLHQNAAHVVRLGESFTQKMREKCEILLDFECAIDYYYCDKNVWTSNFQYEYRWFVCIEWVAGKIGDREPIRLQLPSETKFWWH